MWNPMPQQQSSAAKANSGCFSSLQLPDLKVRKLTQLGTMALAFGATNAPEARAVDYTSPPTQVLNTILYDSAAPGGVLNNNFGGPEDEMVFIGAPGAPNQGWNAAITPIPEDKIGDATSPSYVTAVRGIYDMRPTGVSGPFNLYTHDFCLAVYSFEQLTNNGIGKFKFCTRPYGLGESDGVASCTAVPVAGPGFMGQPGYYTISINLPPGACRLEKGDVAYVFNGQRDDVTPGENTCTPKRVFVGGLDSGPLQTRVLFENIGTTNIHNISLDYATYGHCSLDLITVEAVQEVNTNKSGSPVLSYSLQGGHLAITWPTGLENCVLQSSPNPVGGPWMDFPMTPVMSLDGTTFQVVVPTGGAPMYFRLAPPALNKRKAHPRPLIGVFDS